MATNSIKADHPCRDAHHVEHHKNGTQAVDGQQPRETVAVLSCATQALLRKQSSQQASRLIVAANELLALAAELEDAASRVSDGPMEDYPIPLEDDIRWLRCARRHYRDRRTRSALFGDEALFGEPAWDLLLDLFIAAKERKRVHVTSACIGAAVPTTTALRWLTLLEERGLIVREADVSDARRIFVRLSADAYAKMVSYFVRAAGAEADDTVAAARIRGRAPERADS